MFALTGGVCAVYPGVFDLVASTIVDLMLTGGLVGFLLFAGWVLGRDAVEEYELGAGAFARRFSTPWLYAAGVFIPVFLIFTFVSGLAAALGVSVAPTELLGVTFGQTRVFVAVSVVVALASFFGLRRSGSVI